RPDPAAARTIAGLEGPADFGLLRAGLLVPLLHRDVRALVVTDVELLWPRDSLLFVGEELCPLGHPAGGARNRKEDGEHLDREAHRLVDDARVEVDVR